MQNDIKEEVYKCSKCGLCQSVCPIYLSTKNEMFLARGRYIVLNNFFNNKKKLSRNFIKNLDICLNCNACKDFCPSNIDSNEIFTQLKSEYKYSLGTIPFSIKFFFKLLFTKKEKPLILRKHQQKTSTKEKVVYFQGCINKYVNPSDKNATLNILEKLGYEIVKTSNDCCGLPLLSDGRLKPFNKNAEKIVKSIPTDIKYIVCSCDSCYQTLSKIEAIKPKLIRLDELLKIHNYELEQKNNIVYQKPLTRNEDCYFSPKTKLINRKGACSLMENFLLIKHPKITEEVINTVFYKKEEMDNKTIITTCQLDKVGLKYGIKEQNSNANLYSYSEYICLSNKTLGQN